MEKPITQPEHDSPAADNLVFDRDGFVERMMDDIDIAREIAGDFIDSLPGQLDSLKKAIENQDASAVRSEGHSIKGASASVGAELIRNVAEEIELAGKSDCLDRVSDLISKLSDEIDRFGKVAVEMLDLGSDE